MIGERLTAQGIPTPSEMKRARGEDLGRRSSAAWSKGTIRKILQNPVYLGHMVQGKEEKISFKEKKTRELPRNQWIVVEHTHEAIIKEEIFGDVKNEWQSAGSPEQGYRRRKTHEKETFGNAAGCCDGMRRVRLRKG